MTFKDRSDAGRKLAEQLLHYRMRHDLLVLGLPRGGVVIAYEVAKRLNVPLDTLIVRKLGFPSNPELAIGAVSETGAVVLNLSIIKPYNLTPSYIEEETDRQVKEIDRRRMLYRGSKSLTDLKGKTVILVDDGIATGATFKAAIQALREAPIVYLAGAVPVATPESAEEIAGMVDEWICLQTPQNFLSVGGFYERFDQVTDDEVVEMLRSSAGPIPDESVQRL